MAATFKAHDSTEKQIARDIVCNHFLKLKKGKLTCLSLPSTNFHFERMLLGKSESTLHIDCIERDYEVFNEASKDPILKNKNISFYRNDVFKYLNYFPNKQYDLIWFDLCANMTVNLIQEVCSVVKSNKLADNSYLAVTFMGNREHHDLLRLFQVDNHEEIRTKRFPEIVINSAILANRICKLVECHKYKNDNFKAAPMRLYVFKITKI